MEPALSATQAAPSCSDHVLVAEARRGSDRAFEELFSRYRARIGSYVFGMVGDHQRAEDIAQEVFIAALRRLRATERPIAFKPWLYEIAKNACIDEFRRAQRSREVPLDGDEGDSAPPRLIAQGVDVAIEDKQRLDHLRGAFRGLSESHHRIIVMREFEGRSYTQIGETMGMTRPVVESTLFRARRRLSEEYDELVSGRRCERVQSVIAAEGERPLRSLGVRERRLLARHLAHCQPCRRTARMAGVDESFFQAPGLAAKIAALLPIPWLRPKRSHGGNSEPASALGSHSVAALQSLQTVAPFMAPTGPAAGLGRAAATAAAIVVAGAGGGLVTGIAGQDHNMPSAAQIARADAGARQTGGSSAGASRNSQSKQTAWYAGAKLGGGLAATGWGDPAATGTPQQTSLSSGGSQSTAGGTSSVISRPLPVATGAAKNLPIGHRLLGSGIGRPAGVRLPTPKLSSVKLPGVKLPGVNLAGTKPPGVQLPGVQLPKVSTVLPDDPTQPLKSLPKPQLPSLSLPSVPPLPLPDPSSLLPPLGGQSK